MAGFKHRLTGLFMSALPNEAEVGPTQAVPGREGEVSETFTFYATRVNQRGFERQLRDAAATLELEYAAEATPGLVMCDVVVTVAGDPDRVRQFGRYAAGLSGAADSAGAGTGGG